MENNQGESRLCSDCNTYFANIATNFLCSTCHKKQAIRQTHQKLLNPEEILKIMPSKESLLIPSDPSKCFQCKRNVGLLGTICKCKYTFCNKHRMPEDHDCGVDFRKLSEESMQKPESVAPRKVSEI